MKQHKILKLILTVTAAAAIIWAALTAAIYLSVLTGILYILPFALRDILTTILFFGIWGCPVLAVLNALLYYIFSFITKTHGLISPKLRACALIIPFVLIGAMMLYEMNFGEVLS